MRLYLGNISAAVTSEDLRAMFEHFGQVRSVGIIKDRFTGMNNGGVVVEMVNDVDAEIAISRLHFTQYGGRTISVGRIPAECENFGG